MCDRWGGGVINEIESTILVGGDRVCSLLDFDYHPRWKGGGEEEVRGKGEGR